MRKRYREQIERELIETALVNLKRSEEANNLSRDLIKGGQDEIQ